MKRRLAILGVAAMVVAVGWAFVETSNDKVTICHNQKNTLTVASAAVPAHLNHGDVMGACPASPSR